MLNILKVSAEAIMKIALFSSIFFFFFISLDFQCTLLEIGNNVLNAMMKGSVSQILFLAPSLYLM